MYCSQCGKEIADNSKFCPECGKAISHEKSDNHTDFEKAKLSTEDRNKDKNFTIFSIKAVVILCVLGCVFAFVMIFSNYEQEESYFDNTKTSYSSSIPRPAATPRTIWPTPNTWWLTPTTTNSNPSATFTPTPIPTPTSLDDLRAEIRKNAFVASDKYEGQKLAIVFQVERMGEKTLYDDDFDIIYDGPAIINNDVTDFYCLINNTNEVSDYQRGDFIEVKGRIIKLDEFEIIVSPCEVKANN